jgi:penicillin-insensitive murein DD-endopeptidase
VRALIAVSGTVGCLAGCLAAVLAGGARARAQDAGRPAGDAGAAGDPGLAAVLRARAEAFGRFRGAVPGPPQAVGSTSNGCLVGGMQLPASGPGFEVLHLDRRRRTGHPELVKFVRRLAEAARRAKLHPVLIGDLSQPRGGPTLTGHRSHQTGLDVDVGFTRPDWMVKRKPTRAEREAMMPPDVLDLRTGQFTAAYGPKVERLIELAAADPVVDRIFVNPRIKQQLCQRPAKQRAWLRVVRPWWGHQDHLHVRLKCPAGGDGCLPQSPLPAGDGCGDVAWWLSPDAQRSRAEPPGPPKPPPPMPPACQAMIEP